MLRRKVRNTSEKRREQTEARAFVPHSLLSQERKWAESWLHGEGSIGSVSTDQSREANGALGQDQG